MKLFFSASDQKADHNIQDRIFDCPLITLKLYIKKDYLHLIVLLCIFILSFSWKHRNRTNRQERQQAFSSFLHSSFCSLLIFCVLINICIHKRIYREMPKYFLGGCLYLLLSPNDIALLTMTYKYCWWKVENNFFFIFAYECTNFHFFWS